MFNTASEMLLDYGLNVEYTPQFYSNNQADEIFQQLKELDFSTPTYNICGETCSSKLKVLGFGETSYTFSGFTVEGLSWNPLLRSLKDDIEKTTGCEFNFALLNFYEDGNSSVAAHRNNVPNLDGTPPIPTLSFGAERTVVFTRKWCPPVRLTLESGSLYTMYEEANSLFNREVPAEPDVTSATISVTFLHVTSDVPPPKKPRLEMPFKKADEARVREKWILSDQISCRVKLLKKCVFFEVYEPSNPLKKTILMNAPTFNDFYHKSFDFHILYKNSSFVANNQLLVANQNNKCVFQQIFPQGDGFQLKPLVFILNFSEFKSLLEILAQVQDIMLYNLYVISLPELLMHQSGACRCDDHITEEEARNYFYLTVCHELAQVVKKTFKCVGCEIDHNSQRRHECLNTSPFSMYEMTKNYTLLQINVRDIIMELKRHCTCHYKTDLFTWLNMDNFYSEFEKYFE